MMIVGLENEGRKGKSKKKRINTHTQITVFENGVYHTGAHMVTLTLSEISNF